MTGVWHRYLQARFWSGTGTKFTEHYSRIDEVLEHVITADRVKWSLKTGEDILDGANPEIIYRGTCARRDSLIDLDPDDVGGPFGAKQLGHGARAASHIQCSPNRPRQRGDEIRALVTVIALGLLDKVGADVTRRRRRRPHHSATVLPDRQN